MSNELPDQVTEAASWKNLCEIKNKLKGDLSDYFDVYTDRSEQLTIKTEHIYLDYSRQLVNGQVMKALLDLARERKVKEKTEAMFSGEKINVTENRAVLHTALRNIVGDPVYVDGVDVMPMVKDVLEKIRLFSDDILKGRKRGITGKKFKNILSIGIGGSYLGPEYLAQAGKPYAKKGMNLIFVSNVDGTDIAEKTQHLKAEETLVIIVSKTFTTAETMKNAQSAKKWMLEKLGGAVEVISRHFIAVSTASDKVKEFGIDPDNMFVFWDWVGGRFSATSAVGAVPLSLYLGYKNFKRILDGAFWMDDHFRKESLEYNLPVIAALIDIWNINFMGYNTRAILPYSQAWLKYAPHCQQAEMESNGKLVDIYGREVEFDTGEVVFGEPGTNGQHSFYQLLHQGTNIVPADFIGFINPQYNIGEADAITHHEELMTNLFAQPDALAFGKKDDIPSKNFPGNRPSNVFLLKDQDPFAAGALLALLEHRVAVKGFIWGINSFDQFGVELGKKLGVDMRNRISLYKANPDDPEVFEGLNLSTANSFRKFLTKQL